MDGGIDQVTEKVLKWFEDKMAAAKRIPPPRNRPFHLLANSLFISFFFKLVINSTVIVATQIKEAGIGNLRVAFVNPAKNAVTHPLAKALGTVVGSIAKAGGYVVVSQNSGYIEFLFHFFYYIIMLCALRSKNIYFFYYIKIP